MSLVLYFVILIILIVGTVLTFYASVFMFGSLTLSSEAKWWFIACGVFGLSLGLYVAFTPTYAELVEHDYFKHMESKPECVKNDSKTLSCIEKYEDWLSDSVTYSRRYDEEMQKLYSNIIKHKKYENRN